jgi:hypothetical protein
MLQLCEERPQGSIVVHQGVINQLHFIVRVAFIILPSRRMVGASQISFGQADGMLSLS